MDVKYYMEYKETKKALEEMFEAYYKYKNSGKWKLFKTENPREKAQVKADERYKEIHQLIRKERTIKAEFFEDHFVCTTGYITKEYQYGEVEGIYETDTTLLIVTTKKLKKDKDFYLGLKKGSVRGKSLADLKKFLVERCPKVTEGVQKL